MSKTAGIILLLLLVLLIMWFSSPNIKENFSDYYGQYCNDCSNKTPNQCMTCANCGFCVDRYGNSKCVPGDYKGPYNYEDCYLWYTGDKWSNYKDCMCDEPLINA